MERRIAKRFTIQRLGHLDGRAAVAANVSQSGAYVVSNQQREIGQRVELRFQTEGPSGPLHWECLGQIRRVCAHGTLQGLGIAVESLTVSDPMQLLCA